MNERKWRIAIDVPTLVRIELLRQFPPRFPIVFGHTIEWADEVTEQSPFDSTPKTVQIYGIHTSVSTQTFTVRVGGLLRRPDDTLLRLVQSTMPGVMLVHAGLIELRQIFLLDRPITFEASWQRFLRTPAPASSLLVNA